MVPVIQATADPATVPDDGRSPLAERAIEIETEVLRRGVRDPTEQRHGFGVGRDLPQGHEAAVERNAGLSEHLSMFVHA